MELREFVKDSVVQIILAIEDANRELEGHNAVVSPRCHFDTNGKYLADSDERSVLTEAFEFDVAITADSKTEAGGKGGIKVMGFIDAGGGASHEIKNSSVSHLKFRVPVLLPPNDLKGLQKELEMPPLPDRRGWTP